MVETASHPPPDHTAGRLKYADPRSLPSYPSAGLRPDGAAASAAATLGWSNQKSFDPWKPDKSSSASAAAVLAKDYKMSPSWEPDTNSAGAKAAVLAVGSAGAALKRAESNSPRPPHDGWGNSAAMQAFNASRPASVQPSASLHGSSAAAQAFNASRTSQAPSRPKSVNNHGGSAATQAFNTNRALSVKNPGSPATAKTTTPEDHNRRSLAAAKDAMIGTRPRAASTPSTAVPPTNTRTTESSAASNALDGAALAHRASLKPKAPIGDAGAVSVTTMTRNMFTSHPPVKPEVDEQSDADRLHQSAVTMAKKMYQQQQKSQEQAKLAQTDDASASSATPTGTYLNLQDAAYKQAQERLSKLHDEHQKSREYQEYYGKAPATRQRWTVSNKLRRRVSSDDDIYDRARSEKIRSEMAVFSSKLSQVDGKKRDEDRQALLAVAQRNVKARLSTMDDDVNRRSNRMSFPTSNNSVRDWELRAQHAAQARHEERIDQHKGQIDLGGGRWMGPDEVQAIASKRVQPVLDEINGKAEAEHERQAALKMDEETRKAELEKQKQRDREIKDINKKTRDDEKEEERVKKQQERAEEKARKEEERAAKVEQKRLAKEEKRKSKQESRPETPADVTTGREDEPSTLATTGAAAPTLETTLDKLDNHDQAASPTSGEVNSPTSKVKGWIKNRFSRRKSIGAGDQANDDQDGRSGKRKSFLGGVALHRSTGSTASVDNHTTRSASMRDVAMAGRPGDDVEHTRSRADSGAVSSISSFSDDSSETFEPPRPLGGDAAGARNSSSPTRDSRFREMINGV